MVPLPPDCKEETIMKENLFFEELETVEELGWAEGAIGTAIGVCLGIIVYVGIAT